MPNDLLLFSLDPLWPAMEFIVNGLWAFREYYSGSQNTYNCDGERHNGLYILFADVKSSLPPDYYEWGSY